MKINLFTFDQKEVEKMDLNRFLNSYGLHCLPQGPELKNYFNTFAFAVSGYDQDCRELYEIAEVRKFFSAFHNAWPFWLFCCNLDSPNLAAMTMCCLPKMLVLRRPTSPRCYIQFDPIDLSAFVLTGFRGMNYLFERAYMSQDENRIRSRQIIQYYQDNSHAN